MTDNLNVTWQDRLLHDQDETHYDWTQLDRPKTLADSDIHVWCASLELASQELDRMSLLLFPDEKVRAERFYFARDRNYFIAGRAFLRILLGSYLEEDPSKIDFVYGQYRKPALKSALQDKTFEFNLSHSNGLALYIFSWNRRVGIDVEYVKSMADMDDFAKRFFSPEECRFIGSLSGKQKDDAFFQLWTCKEAFLKANGSGLTVPLNQVEISLGTHGHLTLNMVGSDKEQSIHWRLQQFRPFPGYQAALAVEGSDGKIVFQKLNNVNTV